VSDVQAANSLNAVNRVVTVDSIEGQDVVAALVPGEVNALTVAQQRNLWGVIGAGAVRPDDTEVKAFFAGLFGAATTTRANLIALANQTISRAEELGLGFVKPPDVNEARAMVR